MQCKKIKKYLYEYATKRLDKEMFHEISEHLEGCKRCQLELEELRETLDMLQYVKPPELSADFKDRVMQRIDREEKEKVAFVGERLAFKKIGYKKWIMSGTVAATIIIAAVSIFRSVSPPQVDKIPRGVEIVTEIAEVENPIIIKTENAKESFEKITVLIEQYDGQIVRKRLTDKRVEVIFKIDENAESLFFQELSSLGEVQIEKKGYKDTQGNIVVILNSIEMK